MHKDQKIVQNTLIPALADLVVAEGDPVAERDCTVLARLLRFGPDPLFLMETCPDEFMSICSSLSLSVKAGRETITNAHWRGPGVLLVDGDTGLNPNWCEPGENDGVEYITDVPETHRLEALWLILASVSDCAEEGFGTDTTMLTRIQKAATAISNLSRLADRAESLGLMEQACDAATEFLTNTPWRTCETFGVPLADGDHAFYVGFKIGHKAVAATSGSLTFYGTIPSTTLAEQGITVDKVLSPTFGIVFPKG